MTRPSEMPPEARPGELSVRQAAVTIHTFPDGGGVHVTQTGVKPLALGASAVERRERARSRSTEVQALAAMTALDGAETTVVERAVAAGNVETYPDGSKAVTLPITMSSGFSVNPPVNSPSRGDV